MAKGGIFGRLDVDGLFECYTIENSALAIRAGVYGVTVYDSPTKGRVPLIAVPSRDYIEIHVANFANQLLGCVATGRRMNFASQCIEESQVAFDHLFPQIDAAIKAGQKVTIEILDIPLLYNPTV